MVETAAYFIAERHGFQGDAAITVAVGKVSAEAKKLMKATRQALKRSFVVHDRPAGMKRRHKSAWPGQRSMETISRRVNDL